MNFNIISFLKVKESREILNLYIVQIINQFFPLITIPLLVRNLGYSDYGIITFAISFSNYIFLFSDYGFALSAPKEIAANKDNKEFVNNYYYSVQVLRFILLIVVVLLSRILFIIVPNYEKYQTVCNIFIIYSIGAIGFPTWFFQGMQILTSSSIMISILKLMQFLSLFVYFQYDNSVIGVALIYSLLNIFQLLIGHVYLKKKYQLKFSIFNMRKMIGMLKDGWFFFVTQSATSLFSTANVLILGMVSTSQSVGIFSTAEKIVRAIVNLSSPFCRAIYPGSAKRFNKSFNDGLSWVKKVSLIIIPVFSLGFILTFVLSKFIASIFTNECVYEVSNLVKILSPIIMFVVINNMCGTQIMLNNGKEKAMSRATLLTGIVNLTCSLVLVYYWDYYGMAVSVLFSELFFMCCTIVGAKKIVRKNM